MHDAWIDRALLSLLRKMVKPAPVRISLGSPQTEITTLPSSVPTIWIKDRSSLIALLRNPQMNFGDLYSNGKIMVEGDLVGFLESLYRLPQKWPAKLQSRWLTLTQSNSLRGSRRNVRYHYDLSNDFYRLWLDSQMVYTCAYFPQESAGLEEAQRAKLDLVCRKLWLRPGEKVVEAGCGWGALSLHMARHYGVQVKAFNISREQLAFARERAKREGLDGQVEFIEDDYRNVRGQFDAFVSVGMLEHVGKSNHADLGRVIQRAIGNTGRGLLHFIGRNRPTPLSPWIRKRIFPGGYPPALREVVDILGPHDYSVLDVENLRYHYARTLEFWLHAFERSYDTVVGMFDARFARMWRLYLAGSIAGYRVGTMQLFQVVFAGRQCATLPWTRAYLYESDDQSVRTQSAVL